MATASSASGHAGAPAVFAPSDARWLRLLERHPGALPFHQPAWSATLAECYGFRALVVGVPGGAGDLAAALPVMEVVPPLARRRWVALPFTDRCPPLLADAAAEPELGAALRSAAAGAGIARVEVRAPLAGLLPSVVAVTHELDLAPGAATVERGFSSAARRGARKARREGVVVERAACETDLTDGFYGLHLQTRRRLGVPIQPRRFFALLWRRVLEPGHGHVLLARAGVGGRLLAAAVFLEAGDTVIYKYGASDAAAWPLRPNNLLFAEAIAAAAERGRRTFDFGRSDLADRGLRAFKSGWGATEQPLVHAWLGPPPAAGRGAASRALSTLIRRSPPRVCRAVGEALYRYAA